MAPIGHLVTLSAPGLVRIEIHGSDSLEGTPSAAARTAWAILDSARVAAEKNGDAPPAGVPDALRALERYAGGVHMSGLE